MRGFKLWESSLADLYDSAVEAFPKTTKRQHVTGPVQIEDVFFLPYLGMKTLFVRSRAVNEDREYKTVMLFRGVDYRRGPGRGLVEIDDEGTTRYLKPLSRQDSQVLVRCNCMDFYYRFNFYDHLDRSLYGNKRAPYVSKGIGPPANPMEMPGECKHLMKMAEELRNAGLLKD